MTARTLEEVLEEHERYVIPGCRCGWSPDRSRMLTPSAQHRQHVAQSIRAWALTPEQVERVAKVLATEINGVLGEHWNGPYEGRENNPNQFIATVYQDALAAIYALVGEVES